MNKSGDEYDDDDDDNDVNKKGKEVNNVCSSKFASRAGKLQVMGT